MSHKDKKARIMLMCDPASGPGSLLCLALAAALERNNRLILNGVMSCGSDTALRIRHCRLIKGFLVHLGLPFMPVTLGAVFAGNVKAAFDYSQIKGTAELESSGQVINRVAQNALQSWAAKADPRSLSVVGHAPMFDLSALLKNNSDMPYKKITQVMWTGNVRPEPDEEEMWRPDDGQRPFAAYPAAAEEVFYLIQRHDLKFVLAPPEGNNLTAFDGFHLKFAGDDHPGTGFLQEAAAGIAQEPGSAAAVISLLTLLPEWRSFGRFIRLNEKYRVYQAEITDAQAMQEFLTAEMQVLSEKI